MTIFEWLDQEGREKVCAELAEMASEISELPVTCIINDENVECFEVDFLFEFEDGKYLHNYLYFEEEDCTDLTSEKILKWFAQNIYDEYHYDPYADWTGKQRQFIDLLHDWEHQERPNWMW